MAEKKVVTLGIRMDEPMAVSLKAIADADGLTDSELVRTLVSNLIEERRTYYTRLHSIFGDSPAAGNDIRVGQCDTGLSASSDSTPTARGRK